MQEPLSQILKEKVSNAVFSVTPDTAVGECINKMNTEKVGALLVIQDNQLFGMFTERDVLKSIFEISADTTTPVKKFMSTDLVCAKPGTSVNDAMATFTEKRFRHLPIVEHDRVVGIISIGDITKWVLKKQQDEISVLANYVRGDYQ